MNKQLVLLFFYLIQINICFSQGWDWKKNYSGGTLLADQANNVYVFTDRRISYDWPQPTPFSIKKLDAAGNLIWSKTVSGLEFSAYKINSDNNLIILGNLSAPAIIDNFTMSPVGSKSFFILKLSSTGTVLDVDVYGSSKNTFAKDLFITDNGHYLICGGFKEHLM